MSLRERHNLLLISVQRAVADPVAGVGQRTRWKMSAKGDVVWAMPRPSSRMRSAVTGSLCFGARYVSSVSVT
jgi:hypothetical protein